MKSINILIMLLGHVILICFHHYHINIAGVNPLQFIGFVLLHAMWHYFTVKRAYIRI